MKSAYELAMERLEREDPQAKVSLTDEQKTALAEVDAKYKAKIAEREVFLAKQLQEAQRKRDREEVAQIEKQLRNERLRLEDEREQAKEKIRREASTQ